MPELDPLGTMNSISITASPNFCSVHRSTPEEAFTSCTGPSPLSETTSLLGLLGSMAAYPATHLLFSDLLPRSFQPARSLPLNGSATFLPPAAPVPGQAASRPTPRPNKARTANLVFPIVNSLVEMPGQVGESAGASGG